MGTVWQVNEALLAMEYVPAQDWHGWDKIEVIVSEINDNTVDAAIEPQAYNLHLSVAAVNDAPVLEVAGFSLTQIIDSGSQSRNDTISAFLVPLLEDSPLDITGVKVWDVDTEATGGSLNRPDGFFGTGSADGRGDGSGMLALYPEMKVSISCTYGMIGLGGEYAGLVGDEQDLDTGGGTLTVFGTVSHINAALLEGIRYIPLENWSGIDLMEVRLVFIF